jgi:hypothetical protein
MSHRTRRLKSRASFDGRHRSKAMLLPMKRQAVADISLANHLALAVCRKGQGNAHLINVLKRAVYLTYYLQNAGFGEEPVDLYRFAEAGLSQAAGSAQCDGVWQVSVEVALMLEKILAIHDQQLMAAAVGHVIEATTQFSRFIASQLHSAMSRDATASECHDDIALEVSGIANNWQ